MCFLILWAVFGVINVVCIYLAEVVFRRPDFADEYKFISFRTIMAFMLGAIATPFIWLAPAVSYQDLQMYNRNK